MLYEELKSVKQSIRELELLLVVYKDEDRSKLIQRIKDIEAQSATPKTTGRWRHSNGMIFCGTLRIAKEDFDTDPNSEFKQRIFDKIVSALNGTEMPPKTWMGFEECFQAECGFNLRLTAEQKPMYQLGWNWALSNLNLSAIQWPVVKPEDVEKGKHYLRRVVGGTWYLVECTGDWLELEVWKSGYETIGPIHLPPTKGGEK